MSIEHWLIAVCISASCVVVWKLAFPKPKKVEGMTRLLLFQVIELVKAAKGRQDKLDILFTNMCPGLAGILRMNFDESLELDVNLHVPFRKRKELDFLDTLNHSTQIWRSFTKQSAIPTSKKNLKLKAMLESLEPREAELFLEAAKKNIKLGISKHTLRRCFPDIFKGSK